MFKGVDVSYHNGTIDWSRVKDSVDFAIIRAGYGRLASQKDTKFDENYDGCKSNGIPCGVYWYSYATSVSEIQTEANVFLKTIKGKKFEYPVYLDMEEKSQVNLASDTINAMVKAFCDVMESNGYFVGLYSYDSFFTKVSSDTQSRYTLWVANTSRTPQTAKTYAIHQHSFKGSVSGIAGDVDLDNCYVDYPSTIKGGGFNGYSGTASSPSATVSQYPTWSGVKTFSYANDGNTFVSEHFQVKEFASKSGAKLYSDDILISYGLVTALEGLFNKLRCKTIVVNSGYRTAAHDKAVGGSGSGQHVLGKASDIVCRNEDGIISSKVVCCVASDLGFGGVANISSKYQATHVDVRTGSTYRGDEIYGTNSIWKRNAAWTDFYTYFGLSKDDVQKYTEQ